MYNTPRGGEIYLSLASWKNVVANPEAMGEREKQLWKKIEPVLHSVLDELKANDKIETIYLPIDRKALRDTLEKLNWMSSIHNSLINIASKDKLKRFLNMTSQFNFDEPKLVWMYLTTGFTLALLSTELFKLLLLFHMKDVNHDVSKFSTTIENAARNTWPQLKPFVDNPFRNALAHGTYAIINKKIVLFEDAKLEKKLDEMELDKFMIRLEDQSLLYMCLHSVLVEKEKAGFFIP